MNSDDIPTVDGETFRARIDNTDINADRIEVHGDVVDCEVWEKITAGELTDVSIASKRIAEQTENLVRQEAARIELEIENAILEGYDGVDIHRPVFGVGGVKPQSAFEIEIEPWNYPEPDADNGMRTERYEWRWFDREELKEAIRNGELDELFDVLDGNRE